MDFKSIVKKGQQNKAYRILLTGVEKIGKSTFGSKAPKPLFLCSETGLTGVEFEDTPNITIPSWSFLKDVVTSLKKDQEGYETIVIDTVDWMEEKMTDHILAFHNKQDIADFGHGKGYILVADEWRSFLADLEQLWVKGINIVLLSHSHIRTFSNPVGEDYDRYEMKCSKKVGALTREWVDAVLFAKTEIYVNKDKSGKTKAVSDGSRVIYTQPSPAWEAGNRYSLPPVLPLDWSALVDEIKNAHSKKAADDLYAEIATFISTITTDEMAEEKIVGAGKALERDKGNAAALRLLKNKLVESVNRK